jgi:hypothetical protein
MTAEREARDANRKRAAEAIEKENEKRKTIDKAFQTSLDKAYQASVRRELDDNMHKVAKEERERAKKIIRARQLNQKIKR